MNWNNFEIQVKTFYGLEEALAYEIRKLGGSNLQVKNRVVICNGDLIFLYKLNYSLRTALKITVPIHKFTIQNQEDFYEDLYNFSWEEYMQPEQSFYIDFTVYSKLFSHSQFAMLRMKDAIVDRFRDKYNQRPNVAKNEKALKFHLHIQEKKVTISLDSCGEPLFKRNYRTQTTQAPINEVLAAGILQLAGWDGNANFLDSMCGSGTFLIEAAMLAYNIPAQINRDHFACMNWNCFSKEDWEMITEVQNQKMKEFNHEIIGYDIDKEAIETSQSNIENAHLEEMIQLQQKDFFTSKKEHFPLFVMSNLPYNQRIQTEHSFYKDVIQSIKQNYPNTIVWLLIAEENLHYLDKKPLETISILNGKLECSLCRFDVN